MTGEEYVDEVKKPACMAGVRFLTVVGYTNIMALVSRVCLLEAHGLLVELQASIDRARRLSHGELQDHLFG